MRPAWKNLAREMATPSEVLLLPFLILRLPYSNSLSRRLVGPET